MKYTLTPLEVSPNGHCCWTKSIGRSGQRDAHAKTRGDVSAPFWHGMSGRVLSVHWWECSSMVMPFGPCCLVAEFRTQRPSSRAWPCVVVPVKARPLLLLAFSILRDSSICVKCFVMATALAIGGTSHHLRHIVECINSEVQSLPELPLAKKKLRMTLLLDEHGTM